MGNIDSKPTILLVEGQRAGNDSFYFDLHKAGYDVLRVQTGTAAFAELRKQTPSLIVFDASTMRSSGSRMCNRLHNLVGNRCAILHCRGKEEVKEGVGRADVYLQRPFTPRTLLNRTRQLIPANPYKEEVVRYGDITYYRGKRSLERAGMGERPLTPKVAQLIELFLRHPNELISRRQLMHDIWETDYVGDTRTLDVHIRWVRELIEVNPSKPTLLLTVRGKGYIMVNY